MLLSPREVCTNKRRLAAGKTADFTNNYPYCFLVGYDGYQCIMGNEPRESAWRGSDTWKRNQDRGLNQHQTWGKGGGVGSDWYGKGAHTHTHTHTRRFSSGTTGSVTGSYSKPNEPSQYSIFPCKILLNITPSTSPHTPQTSGWYFL